MSLFVYHSIGLLEYFYTSYLGAVDRGSAVGYCARVFITTLEPCMSGNKLEGIASFEQSLEELECIVNEMEQGDLVIHDALAKFERGVSLTKQAQKALDAAEQKVKILMQSDDGEQLVDYQPKESE